MGDAANLTQFSSGTLYAIETIYTNSGSLVVIGTQSGGSAGAVNIVADRKSTRLNSSH